jgi:hypothetical protein
MLQPSPHRLQLHTHKPPSLLGEDKELSQSNPAGRFVTLHVGLGRPSNTLLLILHMPLNFTLAVSVLSTHMLPVLVALKLCMLSNMLDFEVVQMGAGGCIALVTFEMGTSSAVRKMKFITLACTQSCAQLSKSVNKISYQPKDSTGFKDNFVACPP